MSSTHKKPLLGQIVRVTQGREADRYMIIVDIIDDRFVMLADGKGRKFNKPKKKNILHFEMLDYISADIQNSLLETGRVTNGKLRFTIDKYVNEHVTDNKEGSRA
ncbi:MAG TPA: KOW domain-containing RNA-binding protein [Bacillota bacterium]|nr:KOW domain-containing RNA-binding protein [Bacillota bacterium]